MTMFKNILKSRWGFLLRSKQSLRDDLSLVEIAANTNWVVPASLCDETLFCPRTAMSLVGDHSTGTKGVGGL